jgi:hypothetical protein
MDNPTDLPGEFTPFKARATAREHDIEAVSGRLAAIKRQHRS